MTIPTSRWRDIAFWAAFVGPLIGGSFLGYYASEILRAVPQ